MSNNKKAANSSKFNRSKSFVSKHAFAPSILPNIVSGGPGIVSPLSVNTGRSRNISTLLLSENLDTQKYTPATITETQNMMYAEVEQCHMGDRFWGLDRDMEDRQNENGAMMLEEKISRKMEFHFLTTAKHRQWDNELQEQKFYRSRVGEHQKDMERQQHMKLLNNPSVSTDELISMIWNNVSCPALLFYKISYIVHSSEIRCQDQFASTVAVPQLNISW